MDAFPAFVPLAGRRVIVVGEGRAAEEKAALFTASPADLVRLPDSDAALDPVIYKGAALVFVASAEEAFARRAVEAARAGGAMLVNAVDRPALCDFHTPAIVDRGAVVAAVGTVGAAPALAGRLKHDVAAVMPERLGELAALLLKIRPEVRACFPDFTERKAFFDALLDGPAAKAALAGEAVEAERAARGLLAGWPLRNVERSP